MSTEPTKDRPLSEEEDAFPLSFLFYPWISPMMDRGMERNAADEGMKLDDFMQLPLDEDCNVAYQRFLPFWAEEQALPEPNLFRALRRAFFSELVIGAIFRFVSDAGQIAMPFVLQGFIKWIAAYVFGPSMGLPEEKPWRGYVWGVGVTGMMLISGITNHACMFYTSKSFMKMKSAVMMSIYDKSLRLPAGHGMSGKITSMHITDASKFLEGSFFLQSLWSSPLVILAAVISLYFFIGWAGVLSLVVIILSVPLQGFAASKMGGYRAEACKVGDKRVGSIKELVEGIRIVKFMNWEDRFEQRIGERRGLELDSMFLMFVWRSLFVSLITLLPFVVALATFAMAYGFKAEIAPHTVFPALMMLNILRIPMTIMPMAAAKFVDIVVALGRISEFLRGPERFDYVAEDPDMKENAVEVRHATVQYYDDGVVNQSSLFQPPPQTPASSGMGVTRKVETLMTIDKVTFPRGKLTLIVGATASGKSTLVNTIVGESFVAFGADVRKNGSVAYVAQEAWIMNATLRDNILAGQPLDMPKYIAAVDACELTPDLEQLDGSDQTEIGERGINLSGGQKQRVAFARAVYSGRDIVVMDDPLSAVDPHVCASLFHGCIVDALAGRTRILVTHQQQFLPMADRVVVVHDRAVVFQGTYDELLAATQGDSLKKFIGLGDSEAGSPLKSPTTVTSPASSPTAPKKGKKLLEIPPPRNDGNLTGTERAEVGNVGLAVFQWYVARGGVGLYLSIFFCFALWRACQAIADLTLAWWAARTPVMDRWRPDDKGYLAWFAAAVGATMLTVFIRQVPFVAASTAASRNSHNLVIQRLLRAPMWWYDVTPGGRITNRVSKDMEVLDLVIPENLNIFYNLLLVIVGGWVIMCMAAPWLSIAIVVMLVVFGYVYRQFLITNRDVKRLDAIYRSPIANVMNETLGGLASLRSYGLSSFYVEAHTRRLADGQRCGYAWRNIQRWLGVRTDLLSAVIAGATGILIVAVLSSMDRADQVKAMPMMALALMYGIAFSGATSYLTQIAAELHAAFASVERLREYAVETPQERDVDYGTGPDAPTAPGPSWPAHGEIAFNNIAARYRDGLPLVLDDVSFHVAPGEKVGVVGRTGSGKSTLMLTLFRMVELSGGSIVIDGMNIADLKMADLRSKITIIPQDPVLFKGTIRSNLDPFGQNKDQDIWDALEKAGMSARVEEEHSGLDCTVEDRGANFSVGERQLICLARALLKNCKVLMLDEATASIDPKQDAIIQRTIREEFKNCTVLTIAHRLGTIIDSDKVLVLGHGKLLQYGLPATLLSDTAGELSGMVDQLGPDQSAELRAVAAAKAAKKATAAA